MALEVDEIGIRMRIYGDGSEEAPPPAGDDDVAADRSADLVKACVREVLRILRAMEER